MESAIDVVERAYRFDLTDAEWLEGVVDGVGTAMGNHCGIIGLRYRVIEGAYDELAAATVAMSDEVLDGFRAFADQPQTAATVLMPGFVCDYGRVVQSPEGMDLFEQTLAPTGIWDTLGIKTVDEQGHGVFVGINFSSSPEAPDVQRRRWARVGAHIESAFRLRSWARDAASLIEPADAIFTESGDVDHVEPQVEDALPRLRDAVAQMQHARASRGDVADERALDWWQALADGRWSLVDTFDTDDRRFLVAVRNAPERRDPRELPEQERKVALAAANGHSNKMIGYQLGLPESTVATRLSAAMKHLGCSNRVELIRLVRLLTLASATDRED